MNNRNKTCPCGSGKKFKKCCINKKQRTLSVSMDMETPVTLDGVEINTKTGNIRLLRNGQAIEPKSAQAEVTYKREKGNKVLSRSPLRPNLMFVNTDQALTGFDAIFAVDTNTKIIEEEKVSITGIVWGQAIPGQSLSQIAIGYSTIQLIEFRCPTQNPEKIGWVEAIQLIRGSQGYSDSLSVALIVDSDLGAHDAINRGEEELVPGVSLPDNFTIFYGSSDSKNDSIANRMIELADKEAKKLLNSKYQLLRHEALYPVENRFYHEIRFWEKIETDLFSPRFV
ncbi:MAG: SEC-C domain-containing protein [Desulforhopalus sp.]